MAKITIDDVCRSAWESTRGESATPYDDLLPEYRAKLVERAEAVLAGEWPQGAWEKFEREVCLLADGRGMMQVGSELDESTSEDSETEINSESETPKPKKRTTTTKKKSK